MKDGFFAYMDGSSPIGLVDLKKFSEVMHKSVLAGGESVRGTKDSMSWEYEAMNRIRAWFAKEGITVEDSYRAIDRRFALEITDEDLRVFLMDFLKVPSEELSEAKVRRLFKLIDQYKRGRVNFEDWKRFIQEDFYAGRNRTVMGAGSADGKGAIDSSRSMSSFDWMLNARQQLGLILTRRFNSLTASFEGNGKGTDTVR